MELGGKNIQLIVDLTVHDTSGDIDFFQAKFHLRIQGLQTLLDANVHKPWSAVDALYVASVSTNLIPSG